MLKYYKYKWYVTEGEPYYPLSYGSKVLYLKIYYILQNRPYTLGNKNVLTNWNPSEILRTVEIINI